MFSPFVNMGALTLKPHAFGHRPWERTGLDLDTPAGPLRAGLVGTQVVHLGGSGWIRDVVRFSYDGFRRQRLVQPTHLGRATTWGHALAVWATRVATGRPHLVWGPDHGGAHLAHLVRRLAHPGGPPYGYVLGLNRVGSILQGSFGLTAVAHALVGLPLQLEAETAGLVPPWGAPPPGGLTQVLAGLPGVGRPHRSTAPTGLWTPLGGAHRLVRAVYQVSPVVTLVADAAD